MNQTKQNNQFLYIYAINFTFKIRSKRFGLLNKMLFFVLSYSNSFIYYNIITNLGINCKVSNKMFVRLIFFQLNTTVTFCSKYQKTKLMNFSC